MHKKFPFAFVAALLLLAMACKKDPPLPDPPPNVSCDKPTNDKELSKQLIVGTWRVHRVQFLINTPFTYYPPDTIHSDYQFRNDGTLWFYVNSRFVDSCKYEIGIMKKYTLYPGDTTRNTLWLVNYKRTMYLERLVPIRVCNDSLYLKYQSFAYDNSGDYYFHRIK